MYAEEAGLPGGDCDDENIEIFQEQKILGMMMLIVTVLEITIMTKMVMDT